MNTIHVVEPADESPATGQLAYGKYEFVSAFFQRKVYAIVFRIHDAKKSGVSEALRTAAAVKDFIIQKKADVIAVSDIEPSVISKFFRVATSSSSARQRRPR